MNTPRPQDPKRGYHKILRGGQTPPFLGKESRIQYILLNIDVRHIITDVSVCKIEELQWVRLDAPMNEGWSLWEEEEPEDVSVSVSVVDTNKVSEICQLSPILGKCTAILVG